MSNETLEFIARELSKVLRKGQKRRVWLKDQGYGDIWVVGSI
jgi:hypothetical protein